MYLYQHLNYYYLRIYLKLSFKNFIILLFFLIKYLDFKVVTFLSIVAIIITLFITAIITIGVQCTSFINFLAVNYYNLIEKVTLVVLIIYLQYILIYLKYILYLEL